MTSCDAHFVAEKQLNVWPVVTQPGIDKPLITHHPVSCFVASLAWGQVTVPTGCIAYVWHNTVLARDGGGGQHSGLHCISADSTSAQSWLCMGPLRSGSSVHYLNGIIVLWPQQTRLFRVSRRTGGQWFNEQKSLTSRRRGVCLGRRKVSHGCVFLCHLFSSCEILNLVYSAQIASILESAFEDILCCLFSSPFGVNMNFFSQSH